MYTQAQVYREVTQHLSARDKFEAKLTLQLVNTTTVEVGDAAPGSFGAALQSADATVATPNTTISPVGPPAGPSATSTPAAPSKTKAKRPGVHG